MSKEKVENPDCPCYDFDCPRHGKCTLCQAYHHSHKEKTSCGK